MKSSIRDIFMDGAHIIFEVAMYGSPPQKRDPPIPVNTTSANTNSNKDEILYVLWSLYNPEEQCPNVSLQGSVTALFSAPLR
eukprot:gene5691-337_t